jgi:biopolymer transport protein ExbD
MAELNVENKDKGKGGKPKPKKVSTRVDLTPMVDLGFLLITFFMLTTTLIKPQTMEISMPSKDKVADPPKLKQSLAVTVLLGKNNAVYYYFGAPEDGKDPEVIKSNFSSTGVRKMLLERNDAVLQKVRELTARKNAKQLTDSLYKKEVSAAKSAMDAPMVIIKATDGANYNNLVDILDEMQICNIGRYAVVDISGYDMELLKKSGEPIDPEVN